MNRLRIIPYAVYPADFNMAADEAIMSCQGTVLRFYGWTRPTLSFGRNETGLDAIDLESCRRHQIDWVKRLTGGKTVLHQHELTYSISGDIDAFSPSILQTYHMISHPLSQALQQSGVQAAVAPRQQRKLKSSICFEEVSAYEIAVNGKKLVGSAQYRKSDRFLQHGSILDDLDWELWKQVWKIPSRSSLLERRITTYRQETGTELDMARFCELFAEKLATSLGLSPVIEDFTIDEIKQIEVLLQNYRRTDDVF